MMRTVIEGTADGQVMVRRERLMKAANPKSPTFSNEIWVRDKKLTRIMPDNTPFTFASGQVLRRGTPEMSGIRLENIIAAAQAFLYNGVTLHVDR